MTLGRLILAWLFVAPWFYIATFGTQFAVALALRPPAAPGVMVANPLPLVRWTAVEAAVLTLLASLWFDSLGSGQWWLLFLLIGLLATVPLNILKLAHAPRRWLTFAAIECGDLIRYTVAGALLAWRLS